MAHVRRVILSLLLAAALLGALGPSAGAAVEPEWTRLIGTAEDDRSTSVAIYGGAVYVGGEVSAALPGQVHAGSDDAVVRRYNASGNLVWTRQFGTSYADVIRDVAATADAVYVVGYTQGTLPGLTSAGLGDAFVRKYDVNGTVQWTHQFGTDGYDTANTVAVRQGGVYVGGNVVGALPGQTPRGSGDLFLRRYDTAGTVVWTRQFGTSGYDTLGGMDVHGTSIHLVGAVGAAFPGKTSAGGNDAFLRTYDADGSVERTWQFGTPEWDAVAGVDHDPLGLVVAGVTHGDLVKASAGGGDGFVRRYKPNGKILWSRQFGTSTDEELATVQARGGRVIVGGSTGGALPGKTNLGAYDAYLRTYDSEGTLGWTRQFGTTGNDYVDDVVLPQNATYLAGGTGGALEGEPFNGDFDGYVQRLSV